MPLMVAELALAVCHVTVATLFAPSAAVICAGFALSPLELFNFTTSFMGGVLGLSITLCLVGSVVAAPSPIDLKLVRLSGPLQLHTATVGVSSDGWTTCCAVPITSAYMCR